jgi:hypothetical protein
MPISGLVLTLLPGEADRAELLGLLHDDQRITVGELVDGCLPVVTETGSHDEHEGLWRELESQGSVLNVRLAYHDFSDVEDFGNRPKTRRHSMPRGG